MNESQVLSQYDNLLCLLYRESVHDYYGLGIVRIDHFETVLEIVFCDDVPEISFVKRYLGR
jgi:hypothetical protein